MLQTIRNSEGEPIGTEYVNSPYEQEIADCEEMDFLANNPIEAARIENQRWYDKALAAFEQQGVEVPYEVVSILSRELYKKQLEADKEEALLNMQPSVDFLESLGYRVETHYDYPTPIEYGYAYMEVYDKDGKEITRKQREELRELAWKQGLEIGDYV